MEHIVSLVLAFLACGAICVVAQALMEAFRLAPPVLLNLFLALGGLLTPCGFMALLDALGQGGSLVAICMAGNAFEQAGELLAHGVPIMLLAILGLFASTTLLGMLTGEVRFCWEGRIRAEEEGARLRPRMCDRANGAAPEAGEPVCDRMR